MTCDKCDKPATHGRTTCESCTGIDGTPGPATGAGAGFIGFLLAILSIFIAIWVHRKATGGGQATADGGSHMTLPPEFGDMRSRSANEIPGEDAATRALEQQKHMQRTQEAAERARMWVEHARTMNKTMLGQR